MRTSIQFTIFLLLFSLSLKAQSTLPEGRYKQDGKITWEFTNGFFKKVINSGQTTEVGYADVKNAQLELTYKNSDEISILDINTKRDKPGKDFCYFNAQFFDTNKKQVFKGAMCTFRTADYKPILILYADSLGWVHSNLINFDIIHSISLDAFGYDRIELLAAQFKGKTVYVNAILKWVNTLKQKHEYYRVEKNTADEIILIDSENGKILLKEVK